MKFFIDTANIDDIKAAHSLGVISGVTTNPSIIAKEGKKFDDAISEIFKVITDGNVFAEVVSLDAEGMVKEGKALSNFNKRMIVKIPMCAEGLKATKILSKEGIKVCVTLMFSETQALLAANAGATYVAPFVGRLDDIGWDGVALVAGIKQIFTIQKLDTKIVAASTRHPMHIAQLAKAGCDIATIPYKIIMQMIDNPLTTSGLVKFMADWDTVPKN